MAVAQPPGLERETRRDTQPQHDRRARPAALVALAEERAVRRFVYVSGGGFAGISLMSFLAELPAGLAVVLLVLVVLVGSVLAELQRRRDHEFGMHAVDQRADPALIEALRRRRRS